MAATRVPLTLVLLLVTPTSAAVPPLPQIKALQSDLATCLAAFAPRRAAPFFATLEVSRLSVASAAADGNATAEIAQSIAAFHWRAGHPTAADVAVAEMLPSIEISDTISLLQNGVAACKGVMAGSIARRPARAPGLLGGRGAAIGPAGYFTSAEDGLPVLQFGYSQLPNDLNHTAAPLALGLSLTTVEINPAQLYVGAPSPRSPLYMQPAICVATCHRPPPALLL